MQEHSSMVGLAAIAPASAGAAVLPLLTCRWPLCMHAATRRSLQSGMLSAQPQTASQSCAKQQGGACSKHERPGPGPTWGQAEQLVPRFCHTRHQHLRL